MILAFIHILHLYGFDIYVYQPFLPMPPGIWTLKSYQATKGFRWGRDPTLGDISGASTLPSIRRTDHGMGFELMAGEGIDV